MSDVDIHHLAKLISETTAARGVDRYAVDVCGLSAAEWAEMTGRNRSTVARNLRRSKQNDTDKNQNSEQP